MRTRVYSIPTDRGAIEVSKGAFLTIAKRNQQLANQQREGIKRAKAKPKPASKAVIVQGKSLGIKKVGRLGGLKKKVSLSSSVRNSGREWPN